MGYSSVLDNHNLFSALYSPTEEIQNFFFFWKCYKNLDLSYSDELQSGLLPLEAVQF